MGLKLKTQNLKLKIDKGLYVGGDELAHDEDGEERDDYKQQCRHFCEPQAIAALEVFGQPVDDHSDGEEDEDRRIVAYDLGYLCQVPAAANLVDHL